MHGFQVHVLFEKINAHRESLELRLPKIVSKGCGAPDADR